jgi:hypothetical protein
LNKEYIPAYTSVYLSYTKGREVKIRIGSDHKADFENLAKKYFDANHNLLPDAPDTFEDFLEKATAIDSTFRCYDDALELVLDIRENKNRHRISAKYNQPEAFTGLMKMQKPAELT